MTMDERQVVRAERFELVDQRGRTRARLSLAHDSLPYLEFLDLDENARLSLGLVGVDAEPVLLLSDAPGDGTLALYGSTELTGLFLQRSGVLRGLLAANSTGEAWLGFADRHGQTRLEASVDAYGRPAVAWLRRPGDPYRAYHFDRAPWTRRS